MSWIVRDEDCYCRHNGPPGPMHSPLCERYERRAPTPEERARDHVAILRNEFENEQCDGLFGEGAW